MSAAKYAAALRQLLEAELRCPHCQAENVPGGGKHIYIDDYGLAVCGVCGNDFEVTEAKR